MLERYRYRPELGGHYPDPAGKFARYEDVEPLLKRLEELEAKEQKREQFDQESA